MLEVKSLIAKASSCIPCSLCCVTQARMTRQPSQKTLAQTPMLQVPNNAHGRPPCRATSQTRARRMTKTPLLRATSQTRGTTSDKDAGTPRRHARQFVSVSLRAVASLPPAAGSSYLCQAGSRILQKNGTGPYTLLITSAAYTTRIQTPQSSPARSIRPTPPKAGDVWMIDATIRATATSVPTKPRSPRSGTQRRHRCSARQRSPSKRDKDHGRARPQRCLLPSSTSPTRHRSSPSLQAHPIRRQRQRQLQDDGIAARQLKPRRTSAPCMTTMLSWPRASLRSARVGHLRPRADLARPAPRSVLTRYDLASLFVDDAFYYFQIAKNVGHGHGFTFDGLHETNGFHRCGCSRCCRGLFLARSS